MVRVIVAIFAPTETFLVPVSSLITSLFILSLTFICSIKCIYYRCDYHNTCKWSMILISDLWTMHVKKQQQLDDYVITVNSTLVTKNVNIENGHILLLITSLSHAWTEWHRFLYTRRGMHPHSWNSGFINSWMLTGWLGRWYIRRPKVSQLRCWNIGKTTDVIMLLDIAGWLQIAIAITRIYLKLLLIAPHTTLLAALTFMFDYTVICNALITSTINPYPATSVN